MRRNKMRRNGGFTLVELLIVIMIIGILAGLVMLAVSSAQDTAEATRVINDLRALKSAAQMYYVDTGSWPNEGNIPPGRVSQFYSDIFSYLDRRLDANRYANLSGVLSALFSRVSSSTVGTNLVHSDTHYPGRHYVHLRLADNTKMSVMKKIEKQAASAGIISNLDGKPWTTSRGTSMAMYLY